MKSGAVTVGATTTLILPPADRRRRKILFCNISDAQITIAQDSVAVINQGIVLESKGAFDDEPDAKGYMYQGAYSAISAAGSKILTYIVDET